MSASFDPEKDALNIAQHGMSLAVADEMDLGSALVSEDDRHDYGERRLLAIGPVGDRVCVLVYTVRGGAVRAISLRPASRRERSRFDEHSPR